MNNDLAIFEEPLKLNPVISYPHTAQTGQKYLMSIDVELASLDEPWPYPEEEYTISFILDTKSYFSYEPLGKEEPSIVLHRFGGTYGPAEYLLKASDEEQSKGYINLTLLNGWGIPIGSMQLECEVKRDLQVSAKREVTVTQNIHISPQPEIVNKQGPNSSDVGSWLWSAANILRGAIDADSYADFILPLVFYKRISDVFDDEIQQYIKVYGDEQSAYQNIANDHQQAHLGQKAPSIRFFIPKKCRWTELQNHAYRDLSLFITDTLRTIVDINPDLHNVIDMTDYNWYKSSRRVVDDRLASLIEVLSRYRLGLQDVDSDTLGYACEYLLQKISEAQGKRSSDFGTPKAVRQLMIQLLRPQPQSTIYDPACGFGGLLMAANQYNSNEYDKNRLLKLFGQEISIRASSIAKINAFLHGYWDANIVVGDSLIHPLFISEDAKLQTFDCVVANPPWNQKINDISILENDPWRRFTRFGVPPRSNVDWAWLEHIYASLNKHGRAVILRPLGILSRGSRERDIRRGFVKNDVIECVIQLPEKLLFYNTNVPCAIIILNRDKPVERKNQILLINASSLAEKGKRGNELTAQSITIIAELYHTWETQGKLSRVITLEEASIADYNLLPSHLVRPKSAECLVLILADLSTTYEAFRPYLTNIQEISSPEGLVCEKGLFIAENYSWDVVIAQIGIGNRNENIEIERVISYFNPKIVLSIGVAEGVRDVRVGDIVIATKAYDYLNVYIPTDALLLQAQSIAQNSGWLRWIKPAVSQPVPYIVLAPIKARKSFGASNTSELHSHVKDPLDDTVAIDYRGFLVNTHVYAHLAIRGISELFTLSNRTDITNAQRRVSQYVSAFICELLSNLKPEEILQKANVEEKDKEYLGLVAVSCKDFEEFLREQENRRWHVFKPSIPGYIPGYPLTVEELIGEIFEHRDESGFNKIYVFRNDMEADKVIKETNWDKIPEIKKEELYNYIIRSTTGKDFLWFDCNVSEARNGDPMVLMVYEEAEEEKLGKSELLLPAVIVVGPPNSGKSVLVYNLSLALRQHNIVHHVLRAVPDGEGNWFQEIPIQVAQMVQRKGEYNSEFVQRVCMSLIHRKIPFIVDAGGIYSKDSAQIFQNCTHAIILQRQGLDMQTWVDIVKQHHLPLLAEFESNLHGLSTLDDVEPVLRGTLASLQRGKNIQGPPFEALVTRLSDLFSATAQTMLEDLLSNAPTESVVNLSEVLKNILDITSGEKKLENSRDKKGNTEDENNRDGENIEDSSYWQPAMLPYLLTEVPKNQPKSVYGRAPHWVYLALCIHTSPETLYLFSSVYGWIEPLIVQAGLVPHPEIDFKLESHEDFTLLNVILTARLDYYDFNSKLYVPAIPLNKGVIISGPMPIWLSSALSLHFYQLGSLWIASYYPRLNCAVVVASHIPEYAPGDLISFSVTD